MTNAVARFSSLPRSAKWAIAALVIFGGYFLLVEPVMDRTNRLATRADAIEDSLRRANDLGTDASDEGRLIANGLRAYGTPKAPDTRGGDRGGAVQRIVDGILAQHGVDNATRTERTAMLTGDRARAVAGEGRIEREMVEVSFEADQSVAAAVIADLERSSGISAVSRVKIDRTSLGYRASDPDDVAPGVVRASLTAEAWVYVRSRGGMDSDGGAP